MEIVCTAKRPQMIIAEKGVSALIKVMKANCAIQRPLLGDPFVSPLHKKKVAHMCHAEHKAACLLAELCTVMSVASTRNLYASEGGGMFS